MVSPMVRLGTKSETLIMFHMPFSTTVSAVTAVTEIGTS